jgi:hypothetical protein
MQECETGTGSSILKRVTVRSGGAGHAHSGVTTTNVAGNRETAAAKATNGKIVRLADSSQQQR